MVAIAAARSFFGAARKTPRRLRSLLRRSARRQRRWRPVGVIIGRGERERAVAARKDSYFDVFARLALARSAAACIVQAVTRAVPAQPFRDGRRACCRAGGSSSRIDATPTAAAAELDPTAAGPGANIAAAMPAAGVVGWLVRLKRHLLRRLVLRWRLGWRVSNGRLYRDHRPATEQAYALSSRTGSDAGS